MSSKPSIPRVSSGVRKPSISRVSSSAHKPRKDASDSAQYQANITSLEELLIKSPTLAPTLIGRSRVSDIKTINFNTSSSDGFYMVTTDNDDDCHAILIYKQMQPNGSVKFYIYDPNGKERINYMKKIMIDGKRASQIDVTMTPDGGVNPEGFCALWCIAVMILWDMDIDPRDPDQFGSGMHKINLLNEKIYGPRKISGLRKWFITTIYYLFMKRRSYIPSVTEDFVRDVQQQIRLFLTYSPESPIYPVVNAIANAIDDEKAGRISEKEYDILVNNLVKESITAGAGAGVGAGVGASAHGGGIRRVRSRSRSRSLRHKNKTRRHKWSLKYKRSIDCKHPKGFSQRQHCKYGRKNWTKRR